MYCKVNVNYENITKTIRYIKYNKEKDPTNYYREQCLLFLPFARDENEHLQLNGTWHDVYNNHVTIITENMQVYNKIYDIPTQNTSTNFSDNSSSSTNTSTSHEQYDIALDIQPNQKKKT